MKKLKIPNWDKPISDISTTATYDINKPIPQLTEIAEGMTAYAKYHGILMEIKIQKIVNEKDIEGTITKINTTSETINNLSLSDYVLVQYGYYGLGQDIKI